MKFILYISILVFFIRPASASNSLSTINNFGPSSSQTDFVSVERAETLEYKKYSILGFIESNYQSLAIYNSNESGNDFLSFFHLGLSYGLSPRIEIGIKGPIIFNQTKDNTQPSLILSAKGFTNVEGFVKYKIFNDTTSKFSLMGQLGHARGDEIFYVGPDSGLNLSLSALYEKAMGSWLFAANIGYIQRNPGARPVSFPYFEPINNSITGSVGIGRPITKITKLSGEVLLASHDFVKDNSDRSSTSVEALLSFHTQLNAVNLSYGLGTGLTEGISTPTLRGFFGFQYPFGFPKKDKQIKDIPVIEDEKVSEPSKLSQSKEIILNQSEDKNLSGLDTNAEVIIIDSEDGSTELPPEDNKNSEEAIDLDKYNSSNEELSEKKEDEKLVTIMPIQNLPLVEKAIDNNIKLKTQKIILNNIEFDFNSAKLTQKSIDILNKVLDYIKNNHFVSIEIWGHTDFYGTTLYNEYLGLKRAQAVYDYYKKLGIREDVMKYDAFGERRPVSHGLEDKYRRKNRRVEIIVNKN